MVSNQKFKICGIWGNSFTAPNNTKVADLELREALEVMNKLRKLNPHLEIGIEDDPTPPQKDKRKD